MSAQPILKREISNLESEQHNYILKEYQVNSEMSQEMALSVQNFVCQDLQELDIKVKSMHYAAFPM